MSDNMTCPHCGAPVELNIPTCRYCGNAVSISAPSMDKWITFPEHLPPISPTDSTKSIVVLACDQYTFNVPGIIYDNVHSAYYDFKKGIWWNDFYKEKLIRKKCPEIKISHWMPLPLQSSPDWISINDCLPEFDDHTHLETIDVLACRKGPNYESSLLLASVDYIVHNEGIWEGRINFDSKGPDARKVDVTHWMPLPPGPPKLPKK